MNAGTLVVLPDAAAARHRPPSDHPESPERLRAALDAVASLPAGLVRIARAPGAPDPDVLARVHPPSHLEGLRSPVGYAEDGETWVGPGSLEAALAAAAAAETLARAVASGEARNGFAATRPPGHHAHAERVSGYCLLNNALIAVASLRAHGLRRVAVVDLDAHHGDGTEAGLAGDPEAFFASVHQERLFPDSTGHPEEGPGLLNVALAPGAGDAALLEVVRRVEAAVEAFAPEVLVLSLGADGHAEDPMSELLYSTGGLTAAVRRLVELAERRCAGRILVLLEGGYDYRSLEACVSACISTLADAAAAAGPR